MIGLVRKLRGFCRIPRHDGVNYEGYGEMSMGLRTGKALQIADHPVTPLKIFMAPAIHAVVFFSREKGVIV